MNVKKLLKYDVLLISLSGILPISFWAKLENACAYFLGKDAVGDTIKAEVKAELKFIQRSNPVLFDIGANKGDWTNEVVKFFKPSIKVYQFEPSPANIEILNASRGIVVPYAVSDKKGVATLHFDHAGSGGASLYDRKLEYSGQRMEKSIEVETIMIDDFIAENKITRLDFMKMDIEGNELFALKGAIGSLRSGIIRSLSFEFGGCNIDSRTFLRDFWYLLSPLGYLFYRITPSGGVVPMRNYNEKMESFRIGNYIASLEKIK